MSLGDHAVGHQGLDLCAKTGGNAAHIVVVHEDATGQVIAWRFKEVFETFCCHADRETAADSYRDNFRV